MDAITWFSIFYKSRKTIAGLALTMIPGSDFSAISCDVRSAIVNSKAGNVTHITPVGRKFARNESGMMHRFASLVGLISLALSATIPGTCVGQSAAGQHDVVGSACNLQDQVFVALGRTVLAVPPADAWNALQLLRNSPQRLRVPDPTQPEGCFANPLQAIGIDSAERFLMPDATLWRDGRSFPGTSIPLGKVTLGLPGLGDENRREFANLTCRKKGIEQQERDGVRICRMPENTDVGSPPDARLMSFLFSQVRFPTAPGRDLSVTCGVSAYIIGGYGGCDAAFQVGNAFEIYAKFYRPRNGYGSKFENKIIEFLQQLRASVLSRLQQDYPWPK